MTKLFSRKEMLSRIFGARKAKRLEASLQASGTPFIFGYEHKGEDCLKCHFVFSGTNEGHYFWWDVANKTEKLGYTNN